MQYNRNDVDFSRGNFRVRGDTIEIIPVYEEYAVRIELFGDEIEALYMLHPLTGDIVQRLDSVPIFPASHYVAGTDTVHRAIGTIETELGERLKELEGRASCSRRSACACARRSTSRCCSSSGSARASRTTRVISTDGRRGAAAHAARLLPRRLPARHRRVARHGSADRRDVRGGCLAQAHLVDHGFRLPSAMDNRPLRFDEFKQRIGQTVYLSATPGKYEMGIADGVVEQIIRPTGLVDPEIVVKPSKGQIDDLLEEIRMRWSATSACSSRR
jgi:excinuclease ABC subunit B